MSINFDQAFGIHARALELRSQRGALLARNLAHADTPGYKARDIDFASALAGASGDSLRLATSSRSHFAGAAADGHAQAMYRQPHQPTLDGNTVDSHQEKSRFLDNAIRYQATLSFLNSRIQGLMNALRAE